MTGPAATLARRPCRLRTEGRRRTWRLAPLVVVAVLATSVLTGPPALSAPMGEAPPQGGGDDDTGGPATGPPRPIRWAALGDSYSSGEGLSDSSGECQQSDGAYAPLASDMLGQTGWEIEQLDFRACTGAHASPSPNRTATSYLQDQLYQLDGQYDLITLTIGGNDAGFGDVMRTCTLPDPQHLTELGCWRQVREWNVYHELRLRNEQVPVTLDRHAVLGLLGIEAYDAAGLELQARAAREAWELYVKEIVCYPTIDGRISESSGDHCNDQDGVDAFDLSHDEYLDLVVGELERQLLAHMDLDGLTTKLVAEWFGPGSPLLTDHLSPGGHVVVLGYPRLFADPDTWPPMLREAGVCWEIEDQFASVFRRAADRLNTAIEDATTADRAVSFLPVADGFRGHELCDGGFDDWINGITIGARVEPPFHRFEASFHPKPGGYEKMADLLTRHVRGLNWGNLSGATALVARSDGVEVAPRRGERTPLSFGIRPPERGAREVLEEVLGQPRETDRVPPWPAGDDDEPPIVIGEPDSSGGAPECWDDAFGMSVWRVGEEPYFAALYARTATTIGDRSVEAGALLGYRVFGNTGMVGFNDRVSIGATLDQLRHAYRGTDDRPVFDVTFGERGPRGLAYVLAPVDVVDILDAQDLVLGPDIGAATGAEGGDTIVERGAGLDGLQCGLDLVPELYGEGDPDDGGGGGSGGSGACDARIGIVLDASPSIVDAGAEDQVRSAATGVVDALGETGAEVRISSFTGFPVSLTSGWVSLADPEGRRLARQVVGSLAFEGHGTNWEAALMDLAGQSADVVVFVTDGNPNEYGVGMTSSPSADATNDFDPVALAAGVAAAELLRGDGTRIVAVGAGDVRADSLAQVAGPTEGEDYHTGDFADLGPSLAEIATDLCGSR